MPRKLCLGCGKTPESVAHGSRYLVCGKCYAQGCETYLRGGVWYFIRADGDTERAAVRYRNILKTPTKSKQEA